MIATPIAEHVAEIARRHGLIGTPEPLAGGIVNAAWRIGDHVLRIARTEDGSEEVMREQLVAPWIADAGIQSPRLTAAGLEPQPYTIYARVEGILLADCSPDLPGLDRTYRELGRQVARVAAINVALDDRPRLRVGRLPNTRAALARAVDAGALAAPDGTAIAAWLDRIEPSLGAPGRAVFLHKDVHPWNILVDRESGELAAIIDWGVAGFGDPALEMVCMPLATIPSMLAGFIEEGGPVDDGLVARSLWAGAALSCWEVRMFDPVKFDRRWWRTPMGGWPETSELLRVHFPDLGP
jgi:hygromycin-B 7''-O-kinase